MLQFKVGDVVKTTLKCCGTNTSGTYRVILNYNNELSIRGTRGYCTCLGAWEHVLPNNCNTKTIQTLKELTDGQKEGLKEADRALIEAGIEDDNLSLTIDGMTQFLNWLLGVNKQAFSVDIAKKVKAIKEKCKKQS